MYRWQENLWKLHTFTNSPNWRWLKSFILPHHGAAFIQPPVMRNRLFMGPSDQCSIIDHLASGQRAHTNISLGYTWIEGKGNTTQEVHREMNSVYNMLNTVHVHKSGEKQTGIFCECDRDEAPFSSARNYTEFLKLVLTIASRLYNCTYKHTGGQCGHIPILSRHSMDRLQKYLIVTGHTKVHTKVAGDMCM